VGCKQKRTDAVKSKEQLVVSPVSEGNRRLIHSERFGQLSITVPGGDVKSALVIFSDIRWSTELQAKSEQLANKGFFVIGVDSSSYLKSITEEDEDCVYLAGEIERLIQSVEKGIGIKSFVPAALTGEGIGAKLAEEIFYQHPDSFFGLLALTTNRTIPEEVKFCDFDTSLEDIKAGFASQIKSLNFSSLNTEKLYTLFSEIPHSSGHAITSDLPQGVSDLPLEVLMPEQDKAAIGGETFVIFLSGDGGWASIDQDLSQKLLEQNIPVIGVSSLKYFWKKQTPAIGAKDLERIIHLYSGLFKRSKVALFGFSFGADILPSFVAGLSAESKKMVSSLILLSPGLETDYEIHISEWVGFNEIEAGELILPEVRKLQMPILCLYGEDEKPETLCAVQSDNVKQSNLKSVVFPGDHHFDGDYDKVAKVFLDFIKGGGQ